MELSYTLVVAGLALVWFAHQLWIVLYNVLFHTLAKFPGPKIVCTGWYQAWVELVQEKNWPDVIKEMHEQYGEIVRIGPNELHFSRPEVYHEIYNINNKWDKEETLYHSFGEDRSSFGLLHYRDSKDRKEVIAPLFSKRAISDLQSLVRKMIDRVCDSLAKEYEEGKSSDMLFALRSFTLDTIVSYCFGQDLECYAAKDFRSPFVVAMDASLTSFIAFKHFSLLRRLVFSMPGWLTKMMDPSLGGLVDLQEILGAQINDITTNPALLKTSSHPTIYHRLLDKDLPANKNGVPSHDVLHEEAQTEVFAGADTVGNTSMLAIYHILRNPEIVKRLQEELRTAWPVLYQPPSLETLEKLPYLSAVIKEALRTGDGVPGALPRVVPPAGAILSGQEIPPGTIVGMSYRFVHESPDIFADPLKFDPERWLQPDSPALERWILIFSKGPRSCVGQNLAMCELYLAFATIFRKFDLTLDGGNVSYRDCFVPKYHEDHVRAYCRPVDS